MRQLFTLFIILGLAAAPVFAAQSEDAASCVATAKGPIAALEQQAVSAPTSAPQMAAPVVARVGQPAPDFEANAYVGGKFKNMKLSDSKGRWVLLCFYPGDFTFV
jgi:peroxiredoxin (alkyl hydroperoxide reductase subunit C)